MITPSHKLKSSDGTSMFRKPLWLMVPVVVFFVIFLTYRQNNEVDGQEARTIKARVIKEFPHDPNDFCQGIVVEGDTVFEGTGQYGKSLLKKYNLQTGQVGKQVSLNQAYFGEGITVLQDRVYQITWKEQVCIVYEKETLKPLGQIKYANPQGWGLTTDGKSLYMSDGSSTILVVDPSSFQVTRRIRVAQARRPVERLNELEYVGDELWACIWYEDEIARIDPKTGKIKGYVDCSKLYPKNQRPDKEHVLNGIAFDAKSKRLFITGKLWPKTFEIALPSDLSGIESSEK